MGVEQDYEEAFKWYFGAAEQENKYAIKTVARCFENGIGIEIDLEEAQRWYKMANSYD